MLLIYIMQQFGKYYRSIFVFILYISNIVIMGQIFCSRGRPVEQFYWTSSRFQGTSNRNSTGRPVEIFIAFLDEISNSKTFEANLQNSSGRPVESYWMSSRIMEDVLQNLGDVQQKFYWTSSRPEDLGHYDFTVPT